jgi:hypothetical protein
VRRSPLLRYAAHYRSTERALSKRRARGVKLLQTARVSRQVTAQAAAEHACTMIYGGKAASKQQRGLVPPPAWL